MRLSQVSRSKDIKGGTPVSSGTRILVGILFDYLQSHDGLAEFLKQHSNGQPASSHRRAGRG